MSDKLHRHRYLILALILFSAGCKNARVLVTELSSNLLSPTANTPPDSGNPTTPNSGPADHMVFSLQPSGARIGSTFDVQPEVKIYDANNNLVTTGPDANATLTLELLISENLDPTVTPILTIDSETSSQIVGSGNNNVTSAISATAEGGIARWVGLSLNVLGTYKLKATKANTLDNDSQGSGLMTVTSEDFTVLDGLPMAQLSALPTNEGQALFLNATVSGSFVTSYIFKIGSANTTRF